LVLSLINKKKYFDKSEILIVGVSGGPDSLALLHLLYNNEFNIVVAHVDHMLRGEESKNDLEFVKDFCMRNNIEFVGRSIEVGKYALETGLSTQIAARECRYRFFKEVMDQYKSKKLILAHHGDDQIETITMRLVRGSTAKGIAGIRDVRNFGNGSIIRPLLYVNKAMITSYCEKNNLTPRIDNSNEKDTYTRNRFRKSILPFFYKENPQVYEQFVKFGEELAQDDKLLHELAIRELNKVLKIENNTYLLEINGLLDLPISLQRRGINLILNYLYSFNEDFSQTHVYNILDMITNKSKNFELHLPKNVLVVRSYNYLKFYFNSKSTYSGQKFIISCNNVGTYELPNGKRLIINKLNSNNVVDEKQTYLYYGDINKYPLTIRSHISGDKIFLENGTGSKKVSRIFIDKKIPVEERRLWPVILNSNNEIIWIPLIRKIKNNNSNFDKIYSLTYI
jgi:tRNA(Ile)-lysidine synthase